MPEAVVDHLKNLIPLGRMGEPEGLSHPRCGEDVVGWSAARTTNVEHPFPILQAASSYVVMRMHLSTVSNGRLCQLERQKDFWIWLNQTLTN